MKQELLGVAGAPRPVFPLGKTGGLIEARLMYVRIIPLPCFRWVKPAASLKQNNSPVPMGVLDSFRWVKPAASLKPSSFGFGGSHPGGGFRWVKPAASLKRRDPGDAAGPQVQFPLGKTGGLIEAYIMAILFNISFEVSAG